jgi:uncharacterized protein
MPTVTVPIRVKPGSSTTTVRGSYPGPYGPALIVAVHAPAVDGRATEAAVRAVAGALGVRRADVTVTVGATARNKVLTITDAPDDIDTRIATLLAVSRT